MNARWPIWVSLRAHLAADRRKTGVLAVLLLVMVGIYARLFLSHATPESANAASIATNAPAGNDKPGSAAPAAPRAPARIKPARPLVHDLTRDPFAVRLDQFKADPAAVAPPIGQPARPETQPAAPQQPFVLQSTISGTLPMAWINGRCVQPGESIDGFVLERVEPSRVVLRKGDDVRVLTID
jgi:hypothetical protein